MLFDHVVQTMRFNENVVLTHKIAVADLRPFGYRNAAVAREVASTKTNTRKIIFELIWGSRVADMATQGGVKGDITTNK